MKKYVTLVLCLLLCAVMLTGCGCKHETWNEADCLNPKTCADCGEIEGEALGHSWADATCEAPKTCSACGLTEGEALGHSWTDATCEAPKTCSVCAKTEGEALGHSLGDWADVDNETEERSCANCDYTEQQAIDHKARVRTLLEGDWTLLGFDIEDEFYYLSEIDNADEWDCSLHIGSDGSIKLTYVAGGEENYVLDLDSDFLPYFEEDTAYAFYLEDDTYQYFSMLFISTDGTVQLWCQLDADLWIFTR